jgi:hypothetical protein
MEQINLLFALLYPYFIGASLLALLWPTKQQKKAPVGLFWLLAFAGGFGLIGLVFFLLSLQGLRPTLWLILGLTLPIPLAGRYLFQRRPRIYQPALWQEFQHSGRLSWLLLGFIVLIIVGHFFLTMLLPMWEIDCLAIYSLKAKIFFSETIGKTSLLHDFSRGYAHLDYPLFFPILQSWIYTGLGHVNDRLVRALFSVIFAMMLLAAYVFQRQWRLPVWWSLLLTLLLGLMRPLFNHSSSGNADTLFGLFTGSAALLILHFLERSGPDHDDGDRFFIIAAAAFSSLAMVTKNEGLGFFLIMSIVLSGTLLWRRRLATRTRLNLMITYIGLSLGLALPWLLFWRTIPQIHENYPARLLQLSFSQIQARLGFIFLSIFQEMTNWRDWQLLWIVLVGLLVWLIFAKKSLPLRLAWLGLILLPLSMYILIYAATPHPLAELIPVTLSRLLLHIILPAHLLVSRGLFTLLFHSPPEANQSAETNTTTNPCES